MLSLIKLGTEFCPLCCVWLRLLGSEGSMQLNGAGGELSVRCVLGAWGAPAAQHGPVPTQRAASASKCCCPGGEMGLGT